MVVHLAVPMQPLILKPTHKLVKNYYEALGQFGQLNIDHEMAVRDAFQDLLKGCGQKFHWTLVPEYSFSRPKQNPIRIDGALLDTFRLPRGYWEAKDEHDDLDKEIRAKLAKGYPSNNIIFQAPERAVLFQHGVRQGAPEDIRDPKNLVELLKVFFAYREPHIEEWDDAVSEFKDYIPQIASAVAAKIEEQRGTNPAFVQRFDAFYELCRESINPNLSVQAVEEMLVQHLLTERIFRKIFDNPDFTRRNVIAVEIEKVIDELTKRKQSRQEFLKDLDRFYRAIELAAENTETYKQKQDFINTVYERFFQGYSPKEADTHGIVYTPQPIVDFMVRSVEDILKKEFGRSLSDKEVHILDPFVGTGNFITRVMQEIKTSSLPYKYENELHCNEVMLLPYYVASMNIEHEYLERTGEYQPFPGICLVDTFELAEPEQSKLSFMTEENTARVRRQKESPIFVVIANPPYNMGQVNENDNNKNRHYPIVDRRISDTYAADSTASNVNKLTDPYVRAIRWASDRLVGDGIVAFVSNNSFIERLAFDGMRARLEAEFTDIVHLDLKGNARTSGERRQQEGGNIFDDAVRVGVGITFFIKNASKPTSNSVSLFRVGDYQTAKEKRNLLEQYGTLWAVPTSRVSFDSRHAWITEGIKDDFQHFIPLTRDRRTGEAAETMFETRTLGLNTNRDQWVYNFAKHVLESNVKKTIIAYNAEVRRWQANGSATTDLDSFVDSDESKIKWSSRLKEHLAAGNLADYDSSRVRRALYHPFTREFVYFDRILNHRQGNLPRMFPNGCKNSILVISDLGARTAFSALAADCIVDLHLSAGVDGFQCFPFYTYDEDGSNRRENITDWALNEFRTHYSDANITKWDIFHYVYAVLHHPEYRERYAANLKRELPRIPFVGGTADPSTPPPKEGGSARDDNSRGEPGNVESAERDTIVAQGVSPGSSVINDSGVPSGTARTAGPSTRAKALARDDKEGGSAGRGAEAPLYPNDSGKCAAGDSGPSTPAAEPRAASAQDDRSIFWSFANTGRLLADLHVNYEQQLEYPLERVEKGQLNWRVEKMRLNKDKTSLIYSDFLTLRGIPLETYEYRLGNRSALEWVIDQYQVSTDKRSGITNDPNRADDPEYIVRLIGQVIAVSLETMKIVKSLPPLVTSHDNSSV